MPTTDSSDGTRVHYEVAGSGDIPVVLLHGLGDSTAGWELQLDALGEHCRMLLVDVRGHGGSEHPTRRGAYSIAAMAADVAAAADAEGVRDAHVVGLSMGGAVAFEVAFQRPDLVASLVIVNSGPSARAGGWKGRAYIGLRKLMARVMTPAKGAPMIAGRLFPEPHQQDLRDEFVARVSANDPDAYRESLFALARYDRAADSRRLDVPTLFVHSEHDYSPLEWRQPFVDAMPDADLVQVDGAHHAVPAERPEEFNALLIERLRQVHAAG